MTPQKLAFLAALIAAVVAAWAAMVAYRRCHKARYRLTLGFLFSAALFLAAVYSSVLLGYNTYLLRAGIITGFGMAASWTALAMFLFVFTDKGC